MKKIVALLALAFASSPLSAVKAKHGFYVNSPDGLNVRESPDVSSRKIGVLRYGDFVLLRQIGSLVKIDGIDARWMKISFGNEDGWVFGGYLE